MGKATMAGVSLLAIAGVVTFLRSRGDDRFDPASSPSPVAAATTDVSADAQTLAANPGAPKSTAPSEGPRSYRGAVVDADGNPVADTRASRRVRGLIDVEPSTAARNAAFL